MYLLPPPVYLQTPAVHATPSNPYKPAFTFPSAIVPRTTNKTAGYTPFPFLQKRKIDFRAAGGKSGKVIRRLNAGKLISSNERANQNKLWYNILPGGHIAAFATKGTPDGPTGYIQPAIRAMIEALQDPSSKWSSLLTTCEVTAVLHI